MNLKKITTSLLISTFGLMQLAPAGFAGPDLKEITSGSGSMEVNGDTTNFNQYSENLVAHFNTFDINPSETMNVFQPSAASAALFRILGQDPSQILGTLNANGQLFLLNPNGIMFGPNSQVNVGSLVATTLDIKDSDFLAGNYAFSGAGPGQIINQGTMTARDGGYLALLGGAVENSGRMTADGGSVLLGAGNGATLSIDGRGMMNIAVDEATLAGITDVNGNPVTDAVKNSGKLQADGGVVKVSAKAVEGAFDNIINHSGIAQARSASVRNGVVVFDGGDTGVVRVSGTADATGLAAGQTGGRVEVTGKYVGIAPGAVLDASGSNGGGAVLVGGDYQGLGTLRNAKETIVASGATLKADAVDNGDGGKVVVWSDDATKYYGNLSARGGANGGNGGFAEVSGKENLLFQGGADLGAPNGATGTLLLDPRDITIVSGTPPPARNDAQIGDSQMLFGESGGTDWSLNESTVEALTANVILQAQRDFILGNLADNSLNMAGLIGGEAFVVQAGRHITFSDVADSITTAGGRIHLEADSPHSPSGAADGTGTMTLGALNSNGGDITLIASDFVFSSAVNAGAGNVAIANAVSGTAMGLGTAAGAQLTDTELDLISSTGTVTLGQAVTAGTDGAGTGASTLTNGAITLDELTLGAKNVALVSSSTINDDDDTGVSLATTGSLVLTSNGAIGSLGGAQGLNLDVDSLNVTSTGGNAVVVKNAGTSSMAFNAATGGAGSVTVVQDANDIAVGAVSTTGDVSLTATAGAITDGNAAANNVTATSLTSTSATGVDLDTAVTNITATTSGAGNILINEADGANVLNVSAANGDATVTSAIGDLNVTTVSATGTANLTATAGAITDANAAANNVTAASLVASAATGIELDTTVTNLTATTSGAGNIELYEADGANVLNVAASNGDASVTSTTGNLNVTTISASGTASLTAAAGAITDANAGATNVTANSLAALAATGIDLDTDVADLTAITAGTGNILIDEANGASVQAQATDGDLTVTSTTGDLSIVAADASGTTTLTATAGAITDPNGCCVNVIASSLVASAATGIDLDTTVTNLTATTTGAGNITIDESNGANVLNVAATNGDATVTSATGNLNVTTVSASGTATLTATTGAITDANAAANNVTGGSLVASAATGVDLDTTVTNLTATNSGAGNVTIDEADGANVLNVSAANGDVTLTTTAGNLNISTVSASGAANLTAAAGFIADGNAAANNVTATSLVASSATGIDLDTTVTNMTASTTDAGNITIDETNGANVLNVSAANGDATVTSATGNLAVTTISVSGAANLTATAGAITDANAAATNVTAASLVASAATGVDLDTTVTNLTATNSGAGNVTIDEADGANVLNVAATNGDATVTSASGNLNVTTVSASGTATLTATTGAITDANAAANNVTATSLVASSATGIDLDTTVTNLTATTTGAGNITIDESNGANVLNVAATNGDATVTSATGNLNVTTVSASGTATLTATTGAITDANAAANNVTADTLIATANTGIDLDTTVANLTAVNTGTGNVTIDEADGMNINNVATGTGDITLTTATNNLNVGTIAASGMVSLTAAAGAITDLNAAANNIASNSLVTASATGTDLDTTVTNITATNSGAGNIIINEADGANLLNAAAANGDVTVTSTTGNLNVTTASASGTVNLDATAGSITDANAAATNVTATNLVANAATGIDLDTTVTNLTATNTGAGNINLDESNGANVLNVSAANGNATVTSATGDLNVTLLAATNGLATLTATAGAITDANAGVTSVTGNGLLATAATGIGTNGARLETAVSNLEASGGLGGVFIANTGALTIGGISGMNGVSATGSDIKVTAASPLTVNEAVSNTGGGNVVLAALGNAATDDLTVNANVSTTGGNGFVTIGAGDSIVLASGTTVSTKGTGAVSIVAGEDLTDSETVFNQDGNTGAAGGSIFMGTTANVETEDGDVLLDAASSVTVANVNADSDNDNLEGAITVNARAGAVVDGNGANVNFTGDSVGLTAGAGIGTNADRIETSVNKLEADGGTGGVFLENNKALQIGGVNATLTGVDASGSDIKVFAQGPMTVTEDVVNAGTGNIELAAKGSSAAEDVTLNANVAATGGNGNVLVAAGDAVFISGGFGVSANGTGNVTVAAGENYTDESLDRDGDADGDIVMAATSSVTSQDGNLLLDARRDVVLATANANSNADATRGNVVVNAVTGSITDINGASMNVTGATLLARAGQGVGTQADLIETAVSNFEATGGTGGVHVINTGALVIGGVDAGVTGVSATGNSIEVYAQSPLTVNEAVTNTGGGNITLAALGSAATDDLTLNANVSATGGNGSILLVAGDSVSMAAGVQASALGTGAITVAAGEDYTDLTLDQDGNLGAAGGSITMSSTSSILTEDGNILLDAANAAAISVLNAESDVDSSLGNVTVITRAGAITDANAATLNITADKLLLNGATGVAASGDVMETNVNILEAAGNTGGVFVSEANDLTIGGFTATNGVSATGAGNISVVAQGSLTANEAVSAVDGSILLTSQGPLTVNQAVSNTGTSAIDIFALGNDATRDLSLNANVSSGGGNIRVVSGDTTQINNGVVVSTTGTGNVSVFAGEDFTDLTQNQNGNAGGSILMGSNAEVRTNDGNIVLDARNNAQIAVANADFNADATRGNVDVRARDGAITDMNADTLNVTANGLAMQAAAGIATNTDRLETSASNLDAAGGSGGVFVRNDRDLAIGSGTSTLATSLTGVSATGSDVKITAAGALSASENVANSGGGNIFLHANGNTAAFDLSFNSGADITATGGNGSILLTAGDSVSMGAGSIASVQGAGTVTVAAGEDYTDEVLDQDGSATGDIVMAAGSGVQTPVGNILMDAARNIQVAQLNANIDANGTVGDVAMIARNGAVTDADGATLNITADDLTIQAASGVAVDADRLETQVNKFESNAGTGGLFVSNTGNLEIGSASAGFSGLTATGSDIKVTATGSMNITENVANSGGGNIVLASNGNAASNDVTVNANVAATGGNGNVLIAAGDTLDVEAGRTVSAAGTGDISLLAGENLADSETVFNQDGSATGDVNLKVNNILLTESSVTSEDGDILVDAARNVLATTVNADADNDNARGRVQVMARSGAITDNNDGISANKLNITADGLHMQAATGIATNANRLETRANNLEAAGGTGGMFVQNQGNLTIGGVTPINVLTPALNGLSATGSDIKVFTTGAMTVDEGVVNSGTGNIEMAAQGATGAADMTVNANIAATGGNGNIILAAGDTITQAAATEVSAAGTGAVTLAAGEDYTDETLDQDGSATGDILQASGAVVSSQEGNLLLDAARNVNLSLADADRNANATLGNVRVLARSGAITDSNAAALNVLANTLELQSAQGVAADADRLETTVNNVEATGGTGGVFIQESDALTIGGVTASLGGVSASGNAIKITSEGDMTVSEAVSQTTSGSDILLAARGAGANVNVNAAVSAAGGNGNVTVAANQSVAMNASGSISAAGTGAVNVLAGENLTDSETVFNRDGSATGDVTMNSASSISSQDGNIRVDAQDSLTLSTVNANSSADGTTGNVALRARTGSITDANAATLNVTAQDLLMQAGTSIATNADRLETSATNLAAVADAGGLFVSNTGNVTVTQLTEIAMADGRVITGLAANGGADLVATATGSMTVDQNVTADGGSILLASNGTAATNDLTLNALVQTTGGAGNITVAAGDTVLLTAVAPGQIFNNGSGNINVLAGENLTDSETVFNQDGNAGGDVTMGLSTAIRANDGNILIDARDNAAITFVDTNANSDATLGDATIRARAGAITDVNGVGLNIVARNLSMTAATGIASAADELETLVTRMEAQNGTGGIFTSNTGFLEIGNADAALTGIQNAGGDVRIISSRAMTVNEAIANAGGGNTTVTVNGIGAGDSLNVNANIANTGGNGSMTLSAFDEILMNGSSVVSATGTGAVNATSGTGNAGGDITMAPGSAFRSEDGNVMLTADGDANIAEVNADADGDSARGNVTVNANGNGGANGDILDTNDAPLITNNITAATFAATAAGDIGAPANPIEVNAATVGPLTSGGSTNLSMTSGTTTTLQGANVAGDLNLSGTGNLIIEENTIGGNATLDMTGSIFGGSLPVDDMSALYMTLIARNGTLGTPDLPLHLVARGDAITVFAGAELNGNSVNIHSNITRDGLQFLNTPPGIVQVNHGIAAGENLPSFNKSMSGNYELFLAESRNFGSFGEVRPQETQVLPVVFMDQSEHARTMAVPMVETDVVSEIEVVGVPTVDEEEIRRQAAAEAEARRLAEAEAARKLAEEQARVLAAQAERERQLAAAEEAQRLAAAQEAARRLAAEAEAARMLAEQQARERAAAEAVKPTTVPQPVQPTVPQPTQPAFKLPNLQQIQGFFRPGLRQTQVEEQALPAGASQAQGSDSNSSN